jgi:sialate O-acetylesterase
MIMQSPHVRLRLILAGIVLMVCGTVARPQERSLILDLRGRWAFRIGDNPAWADPSASEKSWDTVFVPARWEDQGYPGYNGYGWYRKHFTVSQEWKGKKLWLMAGIVDDVDEVFVNGHFIGFSGTFPPRYNTDYSSQRWYPLPRGVLNEHGDNVLAVRVYDSEQAGGITGGKVGIAEELDPLHLDVDLAGKWKIMTGDDFAWKERGFEDADWHPIVVPAYWETQGMRDYDGFAWYRLHFRPDAAMAGKRLVLVLGKIDDYDVTFLNGEELGRTGTARQMRRRIWQESEYRTLRAYEIPAGLLKPGEDNVLAVRVLDFFRHGGIWDGPVGLISHDSYAAWAKRQNSEHKSLWDTIREWWK